MILLTHTGLEHSINPPGMDNSLGNPLKLRRALDKGIPSLNFVLCSLECSPSLSTK